MALLYGQLLILQELERNEQRRQVHVVHRRIRDTQDPFTYPDTDFIRLFRLNKEACRYLFNALNLHMHNGRYVNRLPKILRILVALNFFAVGSYQRGIGQNIFVCCSQPMVSRCISEASSLLIRFLLITWIRFPRNDGGKNVIKEGFRQHGMYHIIGVVDRTHVALVKPTVNENIYVNRKSYHSLNCQIICDAHLRILNVVCRWPGSTHDAYIWRQSIVGETMQQAYENGDQQSKIMGDSGYACLPWLLVPLPNPATPQQINFNNTFKRCRSLVERCIGLLKGRFRCLLQDRTLHYNPRGAGKIIMACCILHNVSLHFRVENAIPMWDEIDVEAPPPIVQGNRQNVAVRQLGQQTRQQYINKYF